MGWDPDHDHDQDYNLDPDPDHDHDQDHNLDWDHDHDQDLKKNLNKILKFTVTRKSGFLIFFDAVLVFFVLDKVIFHTSLGIQRCQGYS